MSEVVIAASHVHAKDCQFCAGSPKAGCPTLVHFLDAPPRTGWITFELTNNGSVTDWARMVIR